MIASGELRVIDGLPYRFSSVRPIGNLWSEPQMLDTNTPTDAYDTPKPESCLERIITTCSNKDDTVADFFLGGGTTAVVSKKLSRSFIGCDIKFAVRKLRGTRSNAILHHSPQETCQNRF